MCGVLVGFSLFVPSLASVSAISFPVMPTCARTLWICMVYGVQCICLTIATISSLSGWWCCDVGCWMWLLIRYMLFRLFVHMCTSCWVDLIFLTAMNIALSSALRMFWYPGSLSAMRVLLLGLYTPEPVVLPSILPLVFLVGGINDPFV